MSKLFLTLLPSFLHQPAFADLPIHCEEPDVAGHWKLYKFTGTVPSHINYDGASDSTASKTKTQPDYCGYDFPNTAKHNLELNYEDYKINELVGESSPATSIAESGKQGSTLLAKSTTSDPLIAEVILKRFGVMEVVGAKSSAKSSAISDPATTSFAHLSNNQNSESDSLSNSNVNSASFWDDLWSQATTSDSPLYQPVANFLKNGNSTVSVSSMSQKASAAANIASHKNSGDHINGAATGQAATADTFANSPMFSGLRSSSYDKGYTDNSWTLVFDEGMELRLKNLNIDTSSSTDSLAETSSTGPVNLMTYFKHEPISSSSSNSGSSSNSLASMSSSFASLVGSKFESKSDKSSPTIDAIKAMSYTSYYGESEDGITGGFKSTCSRTLVGWGKEINTGKRFCWYGVQQSSGSEGGSGSDDAASNGSSDSSSHLATSVAAAPHTIKSPFKTVFLESKQLKNGKKVMKKRVVTTTPNTVTPNSNTVPSMALSQFPVPPTPVDPRVEAEETRVHNLANSHPFEQKAAMQEALAQKDSDDSSENPLPESFSWIDVYGTNGGSQSGSSNGNVFGSNTGSSNSANLDGSSLNFHSVSNQGSCGSCYSIASIFSIETRFRLALLKKFGVDIGPDKLQLSAEQIVSCSPQGQACNGGFPYLVGRHGMDFGLVHNDCMPLKTVENRNLHFGSYGQCMNANSDSNICPQLAAKQSSESSLVDLSAGNNINNSTVLTSYLESGTSIMSKTGSESGSGMNLHHGGLPLELSSSNARRKTIIDMDAQEVTGSGAESDSVGIAASSFLQLHGSENIRSSTSSSSKSSFLRSENKLKSLKGLQIIDDNSSVNSVDELLTSGKLKSLLNQRVSESFPIRPTQMSNPNIDDESEDNSNNDLISSLIQSDSESHSNPLALLDYPLKNYGYVGGYYGGCTEELMMRTIFNHGPIVIAAEVPDTLNEYRGGTIFYPGDLAETHIHMMPELVRTGASGSGSDLVSSLLAIGAGKTVASTTNTNGSLKSIKKVNTKFLTSSSNPNGGSTLSTNTDSTNTEQSKSDDSQQTDTQQQELQLPTNADDTDSIRHLSPQEYSDIFSSVDNKASKGSLKQVVWQMTTHAMSAVGFGVENNNSNSANLNAAAPEKYWIVRNSWGASFGDEGYFKHVRGINGGGIEHQAVWFEPDLEKLEASYHKALDNGWLGEKYNGKSFKEFLTMVAGQK